MSRQNPVSEWVITQVPALRIVDDELWQVVQARYVAPGGRLLVCAYGSSRPEGTRADLLVDELLGFGLAIERVDDATHPEHGFVITRVVTVRNSPSP